MSQTVGELLTATLVDLGVSQVFGVVGDALNPFTDAIRREERIKWLGVRHEEGAALAATGQAKLTGRLGVCAGCRSGVEIRNRQNARGVWQSVALTLPGELAVPRF